MPALPLQGETHPGFLSFGYWPGMQLTPTFFGLSFTHKCVQEAVAVGLEYGIVPDDRVATAYRCHPYAAMRGGTIKGVIAELLGRQDGMSRGKGGSIHIFTPSFFGGNGIVGAQVPIGAGIVFAQKYLGKKTATFALYGDGATNQGQVFEAFNMVRNCSTSMDPR